MARWIPRISTSGHGSHRVLDGSGDYILLYGSRICRSVQRIRCSVRNLFYDSCTRSLRPDVPCSKPSEHQLRLYRACSILVRGVDVHVTFKRAARKQALHDRPVHARPLVVLRLKLWNSFFFRHLTVLLQRCPRGEHS